MKRAMLTLLVAACIAVPASAQAWIEDFNGGGAFPWSQIDLAPGGSFAVGWDYNYNLIDGSDPRGNVSTGDGGAAHIDTDIRPSGESGVYDVILTSPVFSVPSGAMLEFVGHYRALNDDSFSVLLSSDGFTTFDTLATYTEDLNTGIPPFPYTIDDALGEFVSLDLSSYDAQDVQVGFRYAGDGWNWWAQVDNVTVTPEPASLLLLGVASLLIRRR